MNLIIEFLELNIIQIILVFEVFLFIPQAVCIYRLSVAGIACKTSRDVEAILLRFFNPSLWVCVDDT